MPAVRAVSTLAVTLALVARRALVATRALVTTRALAALLAGVATPTPAARLAGVTLLAPVELAPAARERLAQRPLSSSETTIER